jgi:nitroreductase
MSYITLERQDIHELIRQRRSRRAFDPNQPVTADELNAVLEAARWAPSSGNGQPWRYVVGHQGDATFAQLFDLLVPGNKTWACNAGVLMLTVTQVVRTRPDGSKVTNRTALHDLGMANLSIALEAEHRGLNVRMMGGYDVDAARVLINATANGFEVGPMLALGHIGDIATLPEDVREKELGKRERKPLGDLRLEI